jgi:hypothetical protein
VIEIEIEGDFSFLSLGFSANFCGGLVWGSEVWQGRGEEGEGIKRWWLKSSHI